MPKRYGWSTLNPDLFVKQEDQWKSQFARMQRWYKRLQELRGKMQVQELDEYDIDTIVAFFQNCYHFGDWLMDARSNLRADIQKLRFQDSLEMRVCRDICNGYKHKRLDENGKHPPLDADFDFYREYDHLEAMSDPDKNPIVFGISITYLNKAEYEARKFDLLDLADKCMDIWLGFLRSHRLVDH